ncbi:hypothetical protein RC55_10805 [Herbaspirillum seropedicae]|nr:hypothetical protein ACP92_22155 [Herbaspirillum seropedicae]NQE29734.1 hypothetical protein [Herbaspirillum seropedicae]
MKRGIRRERVGVRVSLAESGGEQPVGLVGPFGDMGGGMVDVSRMRLLLRSQRNGHAQAADLHRLDAGKMAQ